MAKTVVGVFDDFTAAVNTLPDLVSEGFPREAISLMTPDPTGEYAQYLTTQGDRPLAEDAGVGAGVGQCSGASAATSSVWAP